MPYNGEGSKILSLELIKFLGSPFADSEISPSLSEKEVKILYNLALKNKVALLFLEKLRDSGLLEKSGLNSEYEKLMKKRNEQFRTAIRISSILDNLKIEYSVFKSILPFPSIPNDIDMIHFGSSEEFQDLITNLQNFGYLLVESGADAEQRMFHDAILGGKTLKHPRDKDEYDVDIYNKISASYLIYLDKVKLKKCVRDVQILNEKIRNLTPEAEIIVFSIHSIIPEQLFTLMAYYSILYYLEGLNSAKIENFVELTKENRVVYPVKSCLSIVAELHRSAHGFVPEKIEELIEIFGIDKSETKKLIDSDYKLPFRFSWSAIIKTIAEKTKEKEFRRSMLKQTIYMANPKLARWVLWNIIWRRKRESY
ncbi:MAG: hypothetical protein QXL14_03135 [Candidatus Aenigmatarchaeota archaeon]